MSSPIMFFVFCVVDLLLLLFSCCCCVFNVNVIVLYLGRINNNINKSKIVNISEQEGLDSLFSELHIIVSKY